MGMCAAQDQNSSSLGRQGSGWDAFLDGFGINDVYSLTGSHVKTAEGPHPPRSQTPQGSSLLKGVVESSSATEVATHWVVYPRGIDGRLCAAFQGSWGASLDRSARGVDRRFTIPDHI